MIYFMGYHFWQLQICSPISTYYQSREEFISHDSTFNSWVLVAPESGQFEWESQNHDGETIGGEAGLGEFVCIAPHAPFQRHVTKTLSYHVLQWWFLNESGTKVLSEEVLWPQGKSAVRDLPRLQATLENLRSLPGRTDGWSNRRRAHLLEELFHLAWKTQEEPGTTDPLMREAAQLLHKRAGEAFSMSEISNVFGLGPVQFTRRFRAAHGKNPIEFLTQIRLENAQRLLIETSLPLDEIAFRCGWSSGAYFVSVFKKQFQTTPGTFRKQHRV